MKTYSISQLAKVFKLSRSTLLHYDAIDLLKPAGRNNSNYRLYSSSEYEKLKKINSLRKTGLSLMEIKQVTESDNATLKKVLLSRLDIINEEISALRFQQSIIIKLINSDKLLKNTKLITKKMWVNLLKSSGLDEEGLKKWHKIFEKSAPKAHQDFLESLGISDKEVKEIRNWSKKL